MDRWFSAASVAAAAAASPDTKTMVLVVASAFFGLTVVSMVGAEVDVETLSTLAAKTVGAGGPPSTPAQPGAPADGPA